jgi:hypothetical protein
MRLSAASILTINLRARSRVRNSALIHEGLIVGQLFRVCQFYLLDDIQIEIRAATSRASQPYPLHLILGKPFLRPVVELGNRARQRACCASPPGPETDHER